MSQGFLLLAAVAGAAAFVIALACFLWYAAALSRVFARRGVEPWRAWVPVLNEAEVLRLGGFAPGLVVLYFIPLIALYAFVVRIIAVHRLTARLGHGVGATVLGVVLPPVWATVLAWGRSVPATAEPSTAPVGVGEPGAASSGARAVGGLIAPPPSAAAAVQQPGPQEAPEMVLEPHPEPASAPQAEPASAPVTEAPAVDAVLTDTILMMRSQMESPEPEPEPEPLPAPEPPASGAAPSSEPAAQASAPPDSIDDETVVVNAPVPEETVVVPGRRVVWRLETAEGEVHALDADEVVVGRRPGESEPGVQSIALADSARTLSKRHARLTYDGEVWTIEDLHSTNGVTLIDGSGREQALAPGQPAPASQEMLLGRLGVLLTRSEE